MIGWYRTTTGGFFPGANGSSGALQRSGRNKFGKWLLLLGAGAIGLAVVGRHKSEARPAPSPAPTLDMTSWRGSWESKRGALILIRDDASGSYSPDGKAMFAFRATVNGDEMTCRIRLQGGRPWKLRFIRNGESARLTGLPEAPLPQMPLVISPGTTQAERDAETAKRKLETKAMLVPTELGTFKKAP